ncbi:hypothetical protein J7U46_07405 [Pelomonas sp. V22]|uniref:hypothetical protein n=1 Tax=Pelomonas sp. V22 TaxID=2822139 RepID=UPI0024A9ED79|nr:hypothetical protein [Pelomonas sp. V22]MDI4632871.1 hypothetical protein [Pelomonas sp. V22]
MATIALTRSHRTRLMNLWRSAGWPCKDGVEIDLLAAGLVRQQDDEQGREQLRLTEAGIAWLAEARQQGQRALSKHDRLALRFAEQLMGGGRIVWRELSLRAMVDPEATVLRAEERAPLWPEEPMPEAAAPHAWRLARPDLFSVRNTSVEAYLQPQVHEVKASRADLLSDLRHAAKRQAYEWLSSESYYLFPAGIAEPEEIPEPYGVWVLHGDLDSGRFEQLRPAHHQSRQLPFAVWLALAKATPLPRFDDESPQAPLNEALP